MSQQIDAKIGAVEHGHCAVLEEEQYLVPAGQGAMLSWWRVAWTVAAAMLVVVPLVVYFEFGGSSSGDRSRAIRAGGAFAQRGSPRRGFAGFSLSNATVPRNEIHSGGPPKDGIPALSQPQLLGAKLATYLEANDRVIGIAEGADARAYPLKILNYHEIVNDRIGELPIAVTYCPLCDSAAVFDRRTEWGEREFGVSGLLYNNNVLMYDRGGKTESLWSQLKAEGISGPGARKDLKSLPLELTTWSDWVRRYPNTKVLSSRTGHRRDYQRNPYGSYFQSSELMFSVKPASDRLPPKTRVLGVWSGKSARAYPQTAFTAEKRVVEDRVDGRRIAVQFTPETECLRVVEAEEGVEWMYSFWFAWYAMHPETEVYVN